MFDKIRERYNEFGDKHPTAKEWIETFVFVFVMVILITELVQLGLSKTAGRWIIREYFNN